MSFPNEAQLALKSNGRFEHIRMRLALALLTISCLTVSFGVAFSRATASEPNSRLEFASSRSTERGAWHQKKEKTTEPFEVRKLTQLLSLQAVGPVSPDKKYILLIGKKPDGGPNLYAMDLAQFKVYPPLTKMKWGVSDPCWSPKGDKIAFAGSDDTADFPELYVLNMANSDLVRLTHNRFSDTQPVFTLDGQKIFYASDESPLPDAAFGILHVASLPVGGGKPAYFTSDDVSSREPEVSADGKSVYLVKIDEESGRHSLWEYTFKGEPLRNITGTTFARIHKYSLDPAIGAFIVWGQESVEQQDDLYIVDLKTGVSKRFPEPDLPKTSPAVSPNGKLIAFIGAAERGGQLFLYDVETREIRRLTFLGNHAFSPVFISDSAIVFGSDRDPQGTEAYLVDLSVPAASENKKQ